MELFCILLICQNVANHKYKCDMSTVKSLDPEGGTNVMKININQQSHCGWDVFFLKREKKTILTPESNKGKVSLFPA